MIEGIKAVAFDIDGTLYAEWKLYGRLAIYILKHISFYLNYRKVRKILHRTAPLADFYEYQARLLAERLKITPKEAKEQINSFCYEGLKPYFDSISPYPHLYDTILAFKNAGLKIAVMSDFPPSQKGEIWGIRSLCDVCMGSEESGALKPSIYPFGILARKLELEPSQILYVGNSVKYDIKGANNAGMKSALLLKGLRALFNIKNPDATVCFSNYNQLLDAVLSPTIGNL